MFDLILNPAVISALVSGSITIILFFLKGVIGSFRDKHFHKYKIKIEHEYEQRKKIKEIISKYKTPLLDSAEILNHRLWNFSSNCHKGWHTLNINEDIHSKYYLQSFCYRTLAFLAWCIKFERESLFLDNTLSSKEDLYFIKYIKAMRNIFSDTSLFNGYNYDSEHDTDHFFKDNLVGMAESMITDTGIISFSKFKELDTKEYYKMVTYISTIMKGRECNKWYLINCFHFILMAFLSKYGYDFQITDKIKLENLYSQQPKNKLAINFRTIIERGMLNQCKEMKKSMSVLLAS
ncbi:TPA: hypothetical protein MX248_002078 [Klebsiella michiganensis]|nr:hypothetical protein [Klebsiella michiganensis]